MKLLIMVGRCSWGCNTWWAVFVGKATGADQLRCEEVNPAVIVHMHSKSKWIS